MTRTFIQTAEFVRNWEKFNLSGEDLRRLELEILRNPKVGSVIRGTGKLRKMRFSYQNRGKSGSIRVCYVDFVVLDTIYLITLYSKNEKDNLSKDECNNIKKAIDVFGEEFILGGEVSVSDVYNSIMAGFAEAIEDARTTEKKLQRRVVSVVPVKEYSSSEVKQIREKTGFSQRLFANYMGVSVKTVEAWEAGTNHPNGAASRMLNMMEMDENLTEDFPFVKTSI